MLKKKKVYIYGYTLIEMVVVIGIIVIVLPALFSTIITILQQQSKIYQLQEVKRQGDNALTTIENLIRNSARTLSLTSNFDEANQICRNPQEQTSGPYTSLYFKDDTGNYFQLYLNSTKITSQSAILNNIVNSDLTGSKIQVDSFSLSCVKRAEFSTPLVSISFSLKYKDSSPNAPSMTYQTKVKMRN